MEGYNQNQVPNQDPIHNQNEYANQNQNRRTLKNQSRASFWKGIVVGICFTAILAVLGISIVTLVGEKARQAMQAKDEASTAQEVAVSTRVQEKMEKIAKVIDELYIEEVDTEELETYIYKGMLAGTGDLYAAYYSEEEWNQFMEDASGSYSGIGVTMQYDSAVNMVKVVSINSKAPAATVDIQVGDYIYKVEGEVINLDSGDLTEVASKVRGEEGTTVKLTLLRGDDRKEVEVEVERRNVEVESVTGQMLEDKIGYIQITQFEGNTASQFEAAYKKLKEEGMEGLVLDLRANPGGQVDSVVDIAGTFLPEGLVTYMEDKYGNRQNFSCDGDDTWDRPLTVLIDGNSASASEILAGAIRDYGVGTLMGTTTFGKGIVQQTIDLGDNSALKMTFAKYYTPKGENIHGKGIEPDVVVEYEEVEEDQEYSIEEDNQVKAAVENIKKQMSK